MPDIPYPSIQEIQNTYFPEEEKSNYAPTWSVLDTEPGMDDLAKGKIDTLKKMQDDLGIYPFQDNKGNDRLFLARFEFPKFEEEFQFSEAATRGSQGFIDFLTGVPIDCIEMLVLIGEYSSKADQVTAYEWTGVTAPIPDKLFEWPDGSMIFLNLTAIPTEDVAQSFAPNLSGEPEPKTPKFWLLVQIAGEDKKYPLPGEFLGLGVRMMPDVYGGVQLSSPFIYSGNWVQTVYYASAVIKEITDSRYTVTCQGNEITNVRSSDFSEYQVGDRVTILKDVSTDKPSELWKDDEQFNFGSNWVIVPITYYGGL